MRYSTYFVKTTKTPPADADSVNARLLVQAGFIQRQMAGVYSFLPLGLRVLNKIQNIIREEINAVDGQEILMPALTQIENYQKTKRDALDILFHLLGHGDAEYVLNQSHEEVVTPLVQKYALSYRDLPIAVYQIQNKFRNEARAKSGILRGREFNMKDLYSFHADESDLDAYYERVKEAYKNIYDRFGIGDRTVVTYASGGSFSKYSHEFQTMCDVGEDTIYLCEKCRVAVNKEISDEQKSCPECGNEKLVEKKAIEVGNIFKLRTRFSDAFGFTYVDAEGNHKPVEMGCYGIGPSRIMGTLVEIFNDERGMLWPVSVAPYQVHLVGLDLDDTDIMKSAQHLYAQLTKRGIETFFDDRIGITAGEKFSDADLMGMPWRVVVSKRTKHMLEIKRRSEEKAELIDSDEGMRRLTSV